MDYSQQPSFTRRMLTRASSRRNSEGGSLRCSSDDLKRKLCILKAIDDKPVKIEDNSDSQADGHVVIGGNVFVRDKRKSLKRAQHTTSDSQITRRKNFLSDLFLRRKYSTSHLTDPVKSNVCQNTEDIKEATSDVNQHETKDSYSINQEEKTNEDRSSNFHGFEVKSSSGCDKKTLTNDHESYNDEVTSSNSKHGDPSDQLLLRSLSDSLKPTVDMNKTENMYAQVRRGLKKSTIASNRHENNIENSVDLTRTNDSSSIEVTSNSTKESSSHSSYVEGFTLGHVKWRGPLCQAYMPRAKAYEYYGFDPQTRERNDTSLVQPNLTQAELLKVEYKEIKEPPKMKAKLRTIMNRTSETVKNNKPSDLLRDASSQNNILNVTSPLNIDIKYSEKKPEHSLVYEQIDDSSESVSRLTSLSIAIKELETEIEQLELEPSFSTPKNNIEPTPSSRLYPNLSKVKSLSNGYTPKTLYRSFSTPDKSELRTTSHSAELNTGESTTPQSIQDSISKVEANFEESQPCETNVLQNILSKIDKSNQNTAEIVENNSVATNFTFETPRNNMIKPSLESTRKSSCCDESKHTISSSYIGSALSSIPIPSKTPESLKTDETLQRNLHSPSAVQTHLNPTIPDEVEKFLENALGDELYNTSVTYPPSENANQSTSQYDASALISQERSPFSQKYLTFANDITISAPQNVSTIDRTLTIYKSLTQRIKKKLRPGLKSPPTQESVESKHFSEPSRQQGHDAKLRALLQEANIQQTLMYQANKALTLCRSTKEFHASTEQVESERLLLVAGLRRAAAMEEIKKLANELDNNELYYERGAVTLQDFSLPLRTDTLAYETQTGDFVHWVVLVVSHGLTVWATSAISCALQCTRLDLPGSIQIRNLTPNFKILVRVYTLKLRRSTFNYEEKYHLNRDERYTRCPSPKKLLKKTERQLSPKNQLEHSAIRNTSFVLSGTLELYLHDLTMNAPWPLSSLIPGSILRGTIDLSLYCRLHLSISHSGFITHGDEAGGYATWNRRWCVLRGHILMFWNYPCDEETKEPLVRIDLTNCVSNRVTVINRSLCAKPRTLLIETARRRNKYDRNSFILDCRRSCTIVRNLLSCDTIRDMDAWMAKLNHVISALREWNITSPPPQVQVSEL